MVAGLSSYVVLPRMEDPLLTERAAFILTSLPGADAQQVEALVTEPIEDELREIAEIKEIRSVSRSSLSNITIELRDDVYADKAPSVWSRIRDRVADAEVNLPEKASRPKFERIEVTAYTRLISLVWDPPEDKTSQQDPTFGLALTGRLAEDLREQLLAVPGTKDVDLFGMPEEEVTVEIQPDKVASLGISAGAVSRAILASDSRFSAGLMRGSENDLLIEVSGELDSLNRISSIPVQTSTGGQTITVGDVAIVRRGIRNPMAETVIVEGRPAIVLGCLIQANQRIDWWHVASTEVTKAFRAALPRGVRMVNTFRQDGYVTTRLTELRNNLLIGAASVMLVVLVMMGWRSAVIVGASLPLSAFMVFAGMRWMEIPIHQMSVTGLIIALGLLIDNAIVVVDDVSKKMRHGDSAVTAVHKTVQHLAVPLFGSTLTTALAFAPIAVMPGPAGEFVSSIAVNVIVAIFSSLLLALTVVPALAGFLGHPDSASRGTNALPATTASTSAWYQTGFSSRTLQSSYLKLLQLVTRRPAAGLLIGIVLPVFGFVQARHLQEQFFPAADRDQVAIELELSPSASIQETHQYAQQVRAQLLKRDDVQEVTWWLGRSAPPFYYNQLAARRGESHYAHALVQLDSADNLAQRLNVMQHDLDQQFPEARVLVRQLEQGPPFVAPIEVRIFGPDLDQLAQIADVVNSLLADIPEVTHVRDETSEPQPRLTVFVDEQQARLLGMTHESVAEQMFSQLEGSVGGMIMEGTEQLPVRVRASGADRSSVDRIEAMHVVSPAVAATSAAAAAFPGVPLTALGQVRLKPEQSSILRENRRRMSEVQAWLRSGVLPAPIQAEFQKRLQQSGYTLPNGYEIQFAGEAAERNAAVGNLMASVGVLAVMMVAALVLSFSSFRLAGLIGIVGGLSIGLGLGALWAAGFPFGFMAIIGTMGLMGVAINDSIVVLAALEEDPAARAGDTQAICDVVMRATRHVVATSLTTIAGFLPLILAGGGFWPPMAVTIAGGVGGATVLALIFVPSCYLLLMRSTVRFTASEPTPASTSTAAAVAVP